MSDIDGMRELSSRLRVSWRERMQVGPLSDDEEVAWENGADEAFEFVLTTINKTRDALHLEPRDMATSTGRLDGALDALREIEKAIGQ